MYLKHIYMAKSLYLIHNSVIEKENSYPTEKNGVNVLSTAKVTVATNILENFVIMY